MRSNGLVSELLALVDHLELLESRYRRPLSRFEIADALAATMARQAGERVDGSDHPPVRPRGADAGGRAHRIARRLGVTRHNLHDIARAEGRENEVRFRGRSALLYPAAPTGWPWDSEDVA